jgi:methanogenic corrinoid protein MtbC1
MRPSDPGLRRGHVPSAAASERDSMGTSTGEHALHAARLAMVSALIDGEVRLAQRLANRLLGDGFTFEEIVDGVFAPVQHEFGRRWATGDLGIADEHAASAAVGELITALGAVGEQPTGPTVVAATPEHDTHALGARVVAATLALGGFHVVFLGAAVPADDLGEYLAAQEPFAVTLSCSISSALANAARSIAVAHQLGIPVVAGGRAVSSEVVATRLGADAYAESARDAATILERWVRTPPAALRPAPLPIEEQPSLRRRSAALVAEAVANASRHTEHPERLADEIARLLLVVESAVLLDDEGMLIEHVRWLRAFGPEHAIAIEAVDIALAALTRALDGDLARLGRMLESSAGTAQRGSSAQPDSS